VGESLDEMIDAVQPDKPNHYQVDGNDVVQQSRQNQNQDTRGEGNDRRNVRDSKHHHVLHGASVAGAFVGYHITALLALGGGLVTSVIATAAGAAVVLFVWRLAK
jgi:hypothetical protein